MRMGSLRMFDVRWLRFDVKSQGASLPSSRAKFRDPEEVTLKLSRRDPSTDAPGDEIKFVLHPIFALPHPAPPPPSFKRPRGGEVLLLPRIFPNLDPGFFSAPSVPRRGDHAR